MLNLLLQETIAKAMESRNQRLGMVADVAFGIENVGDTGEHFLGGLVGEGDGADAVRNHALVDKIGDTIGQGSCLTGAGTGDDPEILAHAAGGFVLFRVEFALNIHDRSIFFP